MSSCAYCEIERLQAIKLGILPVNQLACSASPNRNNCLLPSCSFGGTSKNHADKNETKFSQKTPEVKLDEKSDEKEENPAKVANAEIVENEPEQSCKPDLKFGIDRILYGSTTQTARNQRKPPRPRPVFSPTQRQYLENVFVQKKYIQKYERVKIAYLLNLKEKQVKVWFQNRRVKRKHEYHQHLSEVCDPKVQGYMCQQCTYPH